MGTFRIDCSIENRQQGHRSVLVPQMLVDAGSEHTWAPADLLESIGVDRQKKDLTFTMANGAEITYAGASSVCPGTISHAISSCP